MDAADALKAATDNISKFGTMAVMGDSSMAEMNAQAILDAKDDVDDALAKAMMALTDAMTAKDQADAVADDDANKLTLIAELEEAIAEANEQIKAIEMIQAGTTLEFAVAEVTGDNEDKPKSAAYYGQMVAMAIGEALGPIGGDGTMPVGTGTRVPDLVDTVAADLPADNMTLVRLNNHTGKTWGEIVGETSKMRLGTTSPMDTKEVDAASIAGMTLHSVRIPTVALMLENNGLQVVATYKGIPGEDNEGILGTAFCQGSDCKVEAVGPQEANVRRFIGSWYFTPEFPSAYYLGTLTEDGTRYAAETNYAQYGHWLTTAIAGVTVPHLRGRRCRRCRGHQHGQPRTKRGRDDADGYIGHL